MQSWISVILAASAALAFAAPAVAGQPHVMTVQLPDGATAQIAYYGEVPPQIVVSPAMPPVFAADFGPSFAALEEMTAALDRQADAMMREAALAAQMPGTRVYTTYEAMTSNGACLRRTEITYGGAGAAPREISSTSGNCEGRPAAVQARTPRAHRQHRPDLILAKTEGARPYAALVHDAVYRQAP